MYYFLLFVCKYVATIIIPRPTINKYNQAGIDDQISLNWTSIFIIVNIIPKINNLLKSLFL